MADDDAPNDATVQMSAEQLKRLHAELAASRAGVPKVKPGAEAPTPEPEPAYVAGDDAYAEEPAAEEAYAEEPAAEEAYAEEAYAEEPAAEEAYAEEAYAEEAYAEEPAAEEAYAEEPAPHAYAEEAPAEPAPAPAAPPAKPAKAAKPAKPDKVRTAATKPPPAAATSAAPGGGGALLVLGGIGALVAVLGLCLPILSSLQGMTGELWPIIGGTIGMAVGHLLVGLGMFGAVSRTNGVAALVGTLHLIAMAGLTFYMLALFGVVALEGEVVAYVALVPNILPATAWLLSGIWGLAAGAGALGILHGIMAFLGGGALIGLAVGGLAGAFSSEEDIAIALAFGGRGLVLVAAIFLAIAMFGRLRRTPA